MASQRGKGMKTAILFLLITFSINAQVDSTDWKVLEAIEIALKYATNESNSPYDLLYRSPQMVLQEAIEYLDQKEKDIEYLKEIRREYIEKLRKQNHKRIK